MKAGSIKIYGRPISDFLLPDQIEFIQRAFASTEQNELWEDIDKCLE